MTRQVKITDINEFGVLFQILPLVSLDMGPEQIKAELKLANYKLDREMEKWDIDTKNKLEENYK